MNAPVPRSAHPSKELAQLTRFHRVLACPSRHTVDRPNIWGLPTRGLLPQNIAVDALAFEFLPQGYHLSLALKTLQAIHVQPKFRCQLNDLPRSSLPHTYIQSLITNGIVELSPSTKEVGFCINHFTPEKLGTPKARLRLVTDALSANLSSHVAQPAFTPISDLLQSISRAHTKHGPLHFLTIDLKTSFFQIPLPPHARDAFTFACEQTGVTYRFARLPMGYAGAVAIMHNVMLALSSHAIASADVISDVYVDNLLCVSHDVRVLREIRARFQAAANRAHVTIGDDQLATTCTYRGVDIFYKDDHRTIPRYCFALKDSFRKKLLHYIDFMTVTPVGSRPRQLSIQHLETCIGACAYADAVLSPTPVRMFWCLYNQLTRWRQNPSKLQLSLASIHELLAVRRWLYMTHEMYVTPAPRDRTLVFSDASQQAHGWLTLHKSSSSHLTIDQFSRARSLDSHYNICAEELNALVTGINSFGKWSLYLSDNTPAVRAVQRRYSSSAAMFTQLKLLTRERNICVRFIPGTLNPADAPSRLAPRVVTDRSVHCLLLPKDGWCVGGTGRRSTPSTHPGNAHPTTKRLTR